jgi:spermidine synthase
MTEAGAMRELPALRRLPATALFAAALFTSASCMFMMQPMLGKMLLPLVGGTPAGWVVALAFFQLMLLAGYALAWFLARLSPRRHGLAFLGLLGLGALSLPLHLPSNIEGEIGPLLVFRLLLESAGLPFIALAAASSTLQRLFAASGQEGSRDPYFLYAASNLGSFAGLIAYPGFIESLLTIPEQSRYWLCGYILLALLAAACLGIAGEAPVASAAALPAPAAPKTRQRENLRWVVLAFFPSSLMLGVTSYITTDLISAPLVWVLPLGLYLLTFVAAFSRRMLIPAAWPEKIHPTIVALAVALMLVIDGDSPATFLGMGCQLLAFTTVALLCHQRLASLRPLDDERRLPEYYLMIALGGALGGMLNAFVAPLMLDRMAEYPAVLLLSCLLNPRMKAPFSARYGLLLLLGGLVMTAAALLRSHVDALPLLRDMLLVSVCALVMFHPRATLAAGAAIYLASQMFFTAGDTKLLTRNFFGVVRVQDINVKTHGALMPTRMFRHSTTLHSVQLLEPGRETEPTAYFSKRGPLGDIFSAYDPRRVAVLGLGAGTLACYTSPGRNFTFFELDPAVIDMARRDFSFLSKCAGNARVIAGDARLEMAKLSGEKFDLIIFDAFSSDSVPVHLISQEAIAMYLSHLNDHGLLLFNLSSRYVRLESTLAVSAQAAHLAALNRHDGDGDFPFSLPSSWLVMARDAQDLEPLRKVNAYWFTRDILPGLRPWTDSYSSLASVVKFTW